MDQWTPLEENRYDLVCAFDVLEHIETLDEALLDLIAAIRQTGTLAEDSPFIGMLENPMHHEGEAEFVRFMTQQGFSFDKVGDSLRLWSRARRQGIATRLHRTASGVSEHLPFA